MNGRLSRGSRVQGQGHRVGSRRGDWQRQGSRTGGDCGLFDSLSLCHCRAGSEGQGSTAPSSRLPEVRSGEVVRPWALGALDFWRPPQGPTGPGLPPPPPPPRNPEPPFILKQGSESPALPCSQPKWHYCVFLAFVIFRKRDKSPWYMHSYSGHYFEKQ